MLTYKKMTTYRGSMDFLVVKYKLTERLEDWEAFKEDVENGVVKLGSSKVTFGGNYICLRVNGDYVKLDEDTVIFELDISNEENRKKEKLKRRWRGLVGEFKKLMIEYYMWGDVEKLMGGFPKVLKI